MADITKANDVEPTSQDKDKKKKKKRAIIGVTLGVATAGVVVAAVLGARGCSDTNVNVDYGMNGTKQLSNKNIQISVPTGTTDMEGFTWHEEKDLAFNQETISQMNLDSNTIKLEQDKYDYRMNHSEVVADAHKMGKGTMTIDVYKKGTAPTAQKLSNALADKASSDEASDAPVTAKPLFTKTINLTVSFIGQDEATTNISDQLKDPKFSYPAGEVKDPIKAPITIPTDGNASASKELTPDLGASIGLDIPVGSVLPTYTVKSDSKDHSVGTMTITNDGHTTDIKITSGITSTTVTTPKAPIAKTPEEIAAEKAATKAAEEKTKQDAITAAADKAKQDAADKLAAAASAKAAAKQATQDQLKALPVPTGFPTATDKTLPDYISAKDEFDKAIVDFNKAQANGDLDKAQDALDAAKTAKHEAETAITKAQQVKDNLDAELALLTPPKAPGTPTGAPTAEYTKAKADYDAALVDFNAKKAAFDLDGAKAAKVTAETVAATANKHLSADPSVVFAALGTMEALPTNMPTPIPTDIQTLVDEYNAADTDFNALLATPDMANVDKATQDLKTGSVKVAAIKKLIADEATIKALATPKTFPAGLKTLPANFKAEETKYNAAKTAFDAAVATKDPIEAKKQLLLLNAAADKATLLNTHVTGAIAALGALPTLPAPTEVGNERDEYNTAKTDYATAKTAFDTAVANDDVATATTSLADAETAVKLASANLDPKTMSVIVYTYDGKEYATQALALAAAKTGEEAKIAEKTIYKLAGTTFDSKADADDALKAAADKAIKTQTWAAGTAPTDGSVAPAATVQDTVYVFNGQAFETEAQAQAAWLVANPGAPEVEGTFDVMYDGTKVKSFTIGSADKDKYKDEAAALADAKTKFAYVKDGATTGAASVSEINPTATSAPTVADGSVVKIDGTEYVGKTAPEDLAGAVKMTYDDFDAGGTNFNLDGIDQMYASEKPLAADAKGIALWEDGKINKYQSFDSVLDAKGVDGYVFVTQNSGGSPELSAWMSDSLKQKAIDDLKAIGDLGSLVRNDDVNDAAFKAYFAAYRKFMTDVALPIIYDTLKISGSKIVEADALDFTKIKSTIAEFKDVISKIKKQDGTAGIEAFVFMNDGDSAKSGKLDDIFDLMLNKATKMPDGEGNYIAATNLGDVDLATITHKLIEGLKNGKLLFANLLVTPLTMISGFNEVPTYDGGGGAMDYLGSNAIMTSIDDVLKLGTSDYDFHGESLVDSSPVPMHIGNLEGKIFRPVSFETATLGHIFKTSDIDVSANSAAGGNEFIFIKGSTTARAKGTKVDKTDVIYKLADGTFLTDKTKIKGYIPAELKLTKKSDGSDFKLPTTLYLTAGKTLADNDYVTDKTKAEGYTSAVAESRVDKYKLQFDGIDVAGVTEDVKWTTSAAPTAPTLDDSKVTVAGFKAYKPDAANTLSDVDSSAITQETITAGIDTVKAAGDTGVAETTLTKVSGGFSGVVMDGKFYADQAAAEAAYATAHAGDITTEQLKTMFDGNDLKTEAAAVKAADTKAVTEVTSTSKDVPYVAVSSDEPLMVQTFTLDTTNIYA